MFLIKFTTKTFLSVTALTVFEKSDLEGTAVVSSYLPLDIAKTLHRKTFFYEEENNHHRFCNKNFPIIHTSQLNSYSESRFRI